MADETKGFEFEEEPTEANTAPDAEQADAGVDTSLAFPAAGQAPDFSGPGASGTVGSPVDLASPDAAPAEAPAQEPTAGAADAPAADVAATGLATDTLPASSETSSAEPASPSPALPEPSASGALSPTLPGEPADMAGAPSAGKPIDATPATVPTDAGYPVPKEDANEPPIHPTTLQPMVNDGLGDDKGKVADASGKPINGSAAPAGDKAAEAPAEPSALAPSASVDVDAAEGNNLQEVEDAVNALGARFDAIDSKLEGLSASLKKILHKL